MSSRAVQITLDQGVLNKIPSLFVQTKSVYGLRVLPAASSRYDSIIKQIIDEWTGRPEQSFVSHPIIAAYRDLAQALDLDPARVPPAVESLLRRMLRDDRFPRINSVVDAANVTSLEYLVVRV